jgi:serine/threonine-protein phosphatase 6 regulatory subunit 3
MGHLTLISEDIISAMAHYPSELHSTITSLAPQSEWDDYVNGRYMETKRRDTSLLGGGKPVLSQALGHGARGGVSRWKVDEEDIGVPSRSDVGNGSVNTMKGEFRRGSSVGTVRETSADFGPIPMEDSEDQDESVAASPQVHQCRIICHLRLIHIVLV